MQGRVPAPLRPARMEVDEVRRLIAALAITTALVFSQAAGAVASHTGLLFGASTRVVVTMTEYKFEPAAITVEAGKSVDLVFENKGVLPHIFMVYPAPKKTLKGAGEWWEYVLANTYLKDLGEILVHTRGEFEIGGTRVSEVGVEAGRKVTLTFTPGRKGTFEIGCHLGAGGGSHYAAGMKGKLIVK